MSDRKKLSIIYLDDEEINLIMFKEMFKRDFDVYTTTSSDHAVEYIKSNEVDLIITDQLMPNKTGVEFLKELDEVYPQSTAKRVMISGYTQEGEISEAIESRLIDIFISKPWKYSELKDALINI